MKSPLTAVIACFVIAALGCDSPPPSKSIEGNAGTLTWGVGNEKGELRLTRVNNRLEDGVLHIEAWGDTAIADPSGALRAPVVLSGSLPVERDVVAGEAGIHGMTATIPNANVGGEVSPMLKLIARDIDGVDAPWTCSVKSRREIVCNSMHVMPWLGPLPAPTGAMRMVLGFN